eukprot:TRINITY_DN49227_c0_g1_i1.p1 TRINITY_DN49227_c0_g1~~TRINITY_DN49227_c0_g1_i1.p1  ORF type:complete len:400 (-),score=51.38 TRINITY_DN49227_c0_g1_i1:488-1687(-)
MDSHCELATALTRYAAHQAVFTAPVPSVSADSVAVEAVIVGQVIETSTQTSAAVPPQAAGFHGCVSEARETLATSSPKSSFVSAVVVREFHAELCVPCGNKLGECPLWDDDRQLLCWIDIQGRRFWRHNPNGAAGNAESFELPSRPGSFCLSQDGGYVFALEDGFCFYDSDVKRRHRITDDFEPDFQTRLNDGRVDCQGRFVVSGCVEKGEAPLSGVYRLNADLSVEKLRSDVCCGNAIAFSPARGMFFTDPALKDIVPGGSANTIWQFADYDASGMLNPQPFVKADGRPDGAVFDEDGGLWNAEFGSGRVVRYRPDGAVDMIVHVPAKYTTCPAFGDADRRTLYVTDASVFANQRLSRKRRVELPEGYAGGLFRVRLPVSGVLERRFVGCRADLPGGR